MILDSQKKRREKERDTLAHDSILGHDGKVLCGDDVPVAGGGDEHVGTVRGVFHGGDLVASHGSLESVDGIDLGDDDAGSIRAQGLCTLLKDKATVE